MSDKKDDGSDDPEVIIIAPEDQDIIPPEDQDVIQPEHSGAEEASTSDEDAAAKKGTRTGMWIAILVAAAFVGGFVAWPKLSPTLEPWLPDSLKPGASRMEEVTKALDELALRIATLGDNAVDPDVVVDLEDRLKVQIGDLQKRLSDVAARPELPGDFMALIGALNTRIDEAGTQLLAQTSELREQLGTALSSASETDRATSPEQTSKPTEKVLSQLKLFSTTLVELNDRLTTFEDQGVKTKAQAPAVHSHDDLAQEVSMLKSLTRDLVSRLSAAEARLAAVADNSVGGVGAALVAASGHLRSRIESGQAFVVDLDTVKKLAGDDEGLKSVLADLQGGVEGIRTIQTLRHEFSTLTGAILAAAQAPANTWAEKAWQRVSSLVSIRRTGEIAGDDVSARIARAESRLAAADLATAIRELQDLPAAAASVVKPWLDQAMKRLKVLAALDQLTGLAVQRLAQPLTKPAEAAK